ncbi:MAG: Epoxide hydrolase [Ilumatobacteraceae bacterium]|nr:Epoxide hydrolase [Ilumatobacteraceae bacterium]
MPEPFDRPAVVEAAEAWVRQGTWVDSPNGAIWCARFAGDRDAGNPPLLVLHGFPTCAYDWRAVLPALRAERDVVVLDVHGFGLSDKPDHRYSIRGYADDVEAVIAAFGLTEVDLITHDMGDTVGGELLARMLEGALYLTVRRRVVTNGSIYIDMAQLTLGQQVLLGLPDEANEVVATDGGTAYRAGVVGTFAPDTAIDDATDLDLDVATHLAVRAGGLAMLPRTIRYVEDRRAEEARFTGAIESHPSPVGVVWGGLDPVAVHAMAERFVAARPATPLTTLEGVGHYPMIEAPERFATAVLDLLDQLDSPHPGDLA